MQSEFKRDSSSVLVIDDDPAIIRLIKLNIEDTDTQVIEAETGSAGLKVLNRDRIDLLLLDLRLPDLDGWNLLSRLRSTNLLQNLPVIVVSSEPPDRRLIKQYRLNDYIQKPFDVFELVMKVREVIGERDVNKCAV